MISHYLVSPIPHSALQVAWESAHMKDNEMLRYNDQRAAPDPVFPLTPGLWQAFSAGQLQC